MDAFIEAAKNLSVQLIPTLALIVLVLLIVLLSRLIKLINSVGVTLTKTNSTIDLVDKSIEKVQAPLDTVVKVSNTVDKAHDASLEAIANTKEYIEKNAEVIKVKVNEVVTNIKTKTHKEELVKEPSPEDIIGG